MTPFRKLVWPGLATLIALGILLSLGFWQLGRKVEKELVLDQLRLAMGSRPLPIPAASIMDLKAYPVGHQDLVSPDLRELQRIEVRGRFLPARSVPVRATLPSGQGAAVSGIGFFWMTPLELEGSTGRVVFVNRGFVPSGGDWKAPAIPTPEGEQTITGLVRLSEKPRAFTPTDNPGKGEYFSRDPQVMARAVGLAPVQVADLFIDAERAPDNLTPPVGVDPREMIARIPNNHLQYAVTWFAFAVTLIGVFGFFARARLRDPA